MDNEKKAQSYLTTLGWDEKSTFLDQPLFMEKQRLLACLLGLFSLALGNLLTQLHSLMCFDRGIQTRELADLMIVNLYELIYLHFIFK